MYDRKQVLPHYSVELQSNYVTYEVRCVDYVRFDGPQRKEIVYGVRNYRFPFTRESHIGFLPTVVDIKRRYDRIPFYEN